MSGKKHSKYPPSSAYRWLKCPASVLLPPDEVEHDTTAADKGTLAHKMAELKLTADFWNDNEEELAECRENELYDPEMEGPTAGYLDYVQELETDTSETFVETTLDMETLMPGLFGTCDCIVYDRQRNTVDVVDFKYGLWRVDYKDNPQLMLYALGAVDFLVKKYPDIDTSELTVKTHIYQPRIYNVGYSQMKYHSLKNWLKKQNEAIEKIKNGVTERNTGDWCKFCDRQIHCRNYQQELMDCYVDDFFSLSNEEIAKNLDRFQEVERLVKKLKKYGIEQLKSGNEFPGFKIREVNKKYWKDEEAVSKIAHEHNLLSVMSPSQALKKLGKPQFEEMLKGYVETKTSTQLIKATTSNGSLSDK